MRTSIIEHRKVGNINLILASVKLLDQPFRKSSKYPQQKRRRGGVKTGYIIYIASGENFGVSHKSFGYRILTLVKARKFYDICCSCARTFQSDCILLLWNACNCNDAIYDVKSRIGLHKLIINKDLLPSFYDFLLENNLIQIDETSIA